MPRTYLQHPTPEQWLQARQRACMTTQQAADVLGVDESTWRAWENGRNTGPWYALRCFEHETKADLRTPMHGSPLPA
jgi:DNA-binding transcriptional regulator YiaG